MLEQVQAKPGSGSYDEIPLTRTRRSFAVIDPLE